MNVAQCSFIAGLLGPGLLAEVRNVAFILLLARGILRDDLVGRLRDPGIHRPWPGEYVRILDLA